MTKKPRDNKAAYRRKKARALAKGSYLSNGREKPLNARDPGFPLETYQLPMQPSRVLGTTRTASRGASQKAAQISSHRGVTNDFCEITVFNPATGLPYKHLYLSRDGDRWQDAPPPVEHRQVAVAAPPAKAPEPSRAVVPYQRRGAPCEPPQGLPAHYLPGYDGSVGVPAGSGATANQQSLNRGGAYTDFLQDHPQVGRIPDAAHDGMWTAFGHVPMRKHNGERLRTSGEPAPAPTLLGIQFERAARAKYEEARRAYGHMQTGQGFAADHELPAGREFSSTPFPTVASMVGRFSTL